MQKLNTTHWDSAEYLETDEDMAAYLEAAMEEGDPALLTHALGVLARARGMTDIARKTGLSRESLYKALSASGNPEFGTLMKVVQALGLRFHVEAEHAIHRAAARAGQSTAHTGYQVDWRRVWARGTAQGACAGG